MFFGAFGTDVGLFGTSFMYAFRDRETIQDFFEEITGERMMYNYFRPGGVAWDVPENFVRARPAKCVATGREGRRTTSTALMMQNEVVLARCRGLAPMTPAEDAINWGITGPMLRAAGVHARPPPRRTLLDLRPLRLRHPHGNQRRRLRPASSFAWKR